MDHHAFRILGLDTSFSSSEETPTRETPKTSQYSLPREVKSSPGSDARASHPEPKVTVRLADLLPLLIDATQRNRAWIQDFRNDEVTVSQDLYEVALAYRSMGRAA